MTILCYLGRGEGAAPRLQGRCGLAPAALGEQGPCGAGGASLHGGHGSQPPPSKKSKPWPVPSLTELGIHIWGWQRAGDTEPCARPAGMDQLRVPGEHTCPWYGRVWGPDPSCCGGQPGSALDPRLGCRQVGLGRAVPVSILAAPGSARINSPAAPATRSVAAPGCGTQSRPPGETRCHVSPVLPKPPGRSGP